MTDSDAALRARFRQALAARARNLADWLPKASARAVDAPERREFLGELHTLKGEARMLGWGSLAQLCHQLEDHSRVPFPDAEALGAVLDAILLALSPDASSAAAEDLIKMAQLALDSETDTGPNVDPAREQAKANTTTEVDTADNLDSSANASTSEGAWIQVSGRAIDELTDSLSTLSAELSALGPVLESWVRDRPALERTDARARAASLRTLVSKALLQAMDLRLISLDPLFSRLAAHARVLGKQRGKVVAVSASTRGERVERDVANRLFEPLLHLVTNAVDHGLEPPGERSRKGDTGHLTLSARSEGTNVVVTVEDDGRGIDPDHIRQRAQEMGRPLPPGQSPLDLIFESGFSTRTIADDVSGRGVGLEVVKRQIESLGGTVMVQSEPGTGTKFSLSVPAALTQERVLVVRSGGTLYGLPGRLIDSVHGRWESAPSNRTFLRDGMELPLRSLSDLLSSNRQAAESALFVVDVAGRQTAVACEEILGHIEVILRPTSERLARLSGVASSALTERGDLVLVLSPQAFRQSLRQGPRNDAPLETPGTNPVFSRKRVLVVDDSVVVRDLLTEILSSAGYQVRGAKNGKEALTELSDFAPDAVLSDIEMPEMDGFHLLESIRARTTQVPVVLVTARRSPEDRRRAETLGASAYLEKGQFQSKSVLETLDVLLSRTT